MSHKEIKRAEPEAKCLAMPGNVCCFGLGMSTIASPIFSRFRSIDFQHIDIYRVCYHSKPAILMAHPMAQALLQCLMLNCH
jgi:hypothetical protein